jgi:hypothetical protein
MSAALCALGAPVCALADGFYRSVDAEGHVTYSDRAPTAKAQKSTLIVTEGDPTQAARVAKETNILKAEESQRKRTESEEGRNKAQQEAKKQQVCNAARTRYYSIKDANILFKVDDKGNRVFYSDAEGDARKEQARQAMISACGQ